ncbi:hypothetical protein GH714_010481 [Hevea brasiliensis]|uniref:Uncharacterized protein n=1 Tax=Hevea brasiliensis TaxID=3981 RepID=A0A6A6LAM6_HEVBR|nr:hypothetical protein GH714_010481 [Hevea brasiliensis]
MAPKTRATTNTLEPPFKGIASMELPPPRPTEEVPKTLTLEEAIEGNSNKRGFVSYDKRPIQGCLGGLSHKWGSGKGGVRNIFNPEKETEALRLKDLKEALGLKESKEILRLEKATKALKPKQPEEALGLQRVDKGKGPGS